MTAVCFCRYAGHDLHRHKQSVLAKADVPVPGNNDVIEDVDPEKVANPGSLGGETDVLWTWRWIAGGMVVYEDYCRGSKADCLTETVGQADHRGVQAALVDERGREHLVFHVQENHP